VGCRVTIGPVSRTVTTGLRKKRSGDKLAPSQSRFVHEYLIDLNATQAAIRAGYAKRSAHVQGCELLTNPKVCAAIETAIGKREQRTGVKADHVVAELALLAFSNIRNFAVDDTGRVILANANTPDDVWRSVSSMKTKITTDRDGRSYRDVELKLWSKTDALKMLGQHLGMFAERNLNVDLAKLSDAELTRIANGEDPVAVLASSARPG
jgi:phage terminase small subunit